MREARTLGMELRAIGHVMERHMNRVLEENHVGDLTPMHCMILGYLNRTRGRDVYQRDIEKEFSVSRSTVASIIKRMEQKGYIQRESVLQDARLKKVVCTPRGVALTRMIEASIQQTELELRQALTREEAVQMLQMLDKIRKRLTI